MRALPFVALLLGSPIGCGASEPEERGSTGDGGSETEDTFDAGRDGTHDSTPSSWDATPPPDPPDTYLGPVGHCLIESNDWICRAGHICTLTGRCTPDDAGPSEAGSEKCGLIWCDREYCSCRTPAKSICDCN